MSTPDFPTMAEALDWLAREGIPHRQVSPHQIKVCGCINWYPAKGTIVLDNEQRRHHATGRSALRELAFVHLHRVEPTRRSRRDHRHAP